jgi:hypothetical protein
MAKAKPKTETTKTSKDAVTESKPKAVAKKVVAAPAASAAKAKKPSKGAGSAGGMPMIDTSLAAQAAANMVASRDFLSPPKPQAAGEKRESGAFKQLKESFHKPAVQGPGGVLTQQNSQKKSNSGFGGRNQVGHNQTFGADVNRTGVPRRTGG